MTWKERGKNNHYSEQTGHSLWGMHFDVVKKLGGLMPESIPGFEGFEDSKAWLIRRAMRRTPKDGKR